MAEPQRTEGEGREPEHTHDHWHVSHHVTEAGAVKHRLSWHTHEPNHTELTHSHDYRQEDEERHHAKEAHIHDHAAPMESPA